LLFAAAWVKLLAAIDARTAGRPGPHAF